MMYSVGSLSPLRISINLGYAWLSNTVNENNGIVTEPIS